LCVSDRSELETYSFEPFFSSSNDRYYHFQKILTFSPELLSILRKFLSFLLSLFRTRHFSRGFLTGAGIMMSPSCHALWGIKKDHVLYLFISGSVTSNSDIFLIALS